jgi:hypothetical protein
MPGRPRLINLFCACDQQGCAERPSPRGGDGFAGRMEIADGMHDAIDGLVHQKAVYFIEENAVGTRIWLTMLLTI